MSERSNCKRGSKSCPRCLTGHFKKSARRHDRTVATRELRKLTADEGR
jgi:hypothetical protein